MGIEIDGDLGRRCDVFIIEGRERHQEIKMGRRKDDKSVRISHCSCFCFFVFL